MSHKTHLRWIEEAESRRVWLCAEFPPPPSRPSMAGGGAVNSHNWVGRVLTLMRKPVNSIVGRSPAGSTAGRSDRP